MENNKNEHKMAEILLETHDDGFSVNLTWNPSFVMTDDVRENMSRLIAEVVAYFATGQKGEISIISKMPEPEQTTVYNEDIKVEWW